MFATLALASGASASLRCFLRTISPVNIGKTYVKDVRVVVNELIIQLRTAAVDGTPVTRTSTFSRIG